MEGGILLNGGAGSGTGNLDLDIQHFPFDITAAPFDKTLSINYSKKVPTIKCVPVYSGTGYALMDYTYQDQYGEYCDGTASGQGEFSDKDWPVNLQSGESKTANIIMPVTSYIFSSAVSVTFTLTCTSSTIICKIYCKHTTPQSSNKNGFVNIDLHGYVEVLISGV